MRKLNKFLILFLGIATAFGQLYSSETTHSSVPFVQINLDNIDIKTSSLDIAKREIVLEKARIFLEVITGKRQLTHFEAKEIFGELFATRDQDVINSGVIYTEEFPKDKQWEFLTLSDIDVFLNNTKESLYCRLLREKFSDQLEFIYHRGIIFYAFDENTKRINSNRPVQPAGDILTIIIIGRTENTPKSDLRVHVFTFIISSDEDSDNAINAPDDCHFVHLFYGNQELNDYCGLGYGGKIVSNPEINTFLKSCGQNNIFSLKQLEDIISKYGLKL